MSAAPLPIVVVEDSPTQRAALVRVLEGDGDIRVVATAEDVDGAVRTVDEHRPGAVLMDLGLPGGGGVAAIARIMASQPVPVLALSALIADRDAGLAVEALAAGAVDVLPKPERWDEAETTDLRRRLRRVARVPVVRRRPPAARTAEAGPDVTAHGEARPTAPREPASAGVVVGVVASTGGPAALVALLQALAGVPVPVLVVQHIHPSFASGLAGWLGRATGWPAEVAAAGAPPRAGTVHLAGSGAHLVLDRGGRLACSAEPADTLHRPSGDILLASLAERLGARAVGIVLTGMGDDGAQGLLAIRRAGGTTFAQDAETSAVFGMPRAAAACGATDALLPPSGIAEAIRRSVRAAV